MTTPAQLSLVSTEERRPVRGEHPWCLDCGKVAPGGTWGPPGLDEIELSDGSAHTVALPEQWLCSKHSRARWKHYEHQIKHLTPRLRRLAAFRLAELEGHQGAQKFAAAEAWLRAGWQPGDPPPALEGHPPRVTQTQRDPGGTPPSEVQGAP